jgi:hypothetical protein
MQFSPDTFDFTTESTAPEPAGPSGVPEYLVVAQVTDDTFDFTPELTTEPTAPAPGWGPWEVNPRLTTEPTAAEPASTDKDHADWVMILTFDHADGSIDDLAVDPTETPADPITFTYTVRNTSSEYEGSHALYQDVLIPI